jgi:hypothetical protein
MRQSSGFRFKVLVMSALVVLVSMALVGTVGANGNDLMPCQLQETCNGTAGYYGPGMMGGYGYGYGMMNTSAAQVMESIEVSAMGSQMHEEMEGLVEKMMAGNLSSADQSRLVEIMNTYPGASNMMMTRRFGGYGPNAGGYPGMMGTYGPYYGGAGMMNEGFMVVGIILAGLFYLVWLVAGILLIFWLVRQSGKDKVHS